MAIYISLWKDRREIAIIKDLRQLCRQLNDSSFILIGGKKSFIFIKGKLMKQSSDNKLQVISGTDNYNGVKQIIFSKFVNKDTKASTVNHIVSTQATSIFNNTSPSLKND